MKRVLSFMARMGLFMGGLLGMGATYQPVITKPVQLDTGYKVSRTRYQRKLVEYPADLPQFPITRQVARAELRNTAFRVRTAWLELEGKRNTPERRSRESRRFWTVGYITAREMLKQARWTQVLDSRGTISDECRTWAAGWGARSGRV